MMMLMMECMMALAALMLFIFTVALVYKFTSVYTNIPPCRRDEMKRSFLLQEGIFVYSRVFVQ